MEKETTTKEKNITNQTKSRTSTSNGMKADVYNQTGKKTTSIDLPESVFAVAWNPDLVHQVVVAEAANARVNIAHAKDRSERRGGGRKPWRQKGTGRARHGSVRSPIWRKGGVTFGPRNDQDFSKKVNKKMRNKALAAVLSEKLRDGQVLFVDEFSFDVPKTAQAVDSLKKLAGIEGMEALATKEKNAALIASAEKSEVVWKSFRNISNVKLEETRMLTVGDLLGSTYVIFVAPEKSVETLKSRVESKK